MEQKNVDQKADQYPWVRKPGTVLPEEIIRNGIPFLSFPMLEETGLVVQGFTTRMGGVSKGCFASMNLSFTRGDDEADVRENHRLAAEALGYDWKRAILTHQTHTDNILVVTEADAGKGITKEKGYTGIDGLMTNTPGVALIAFGADCVPLYFLDPVHKVIALVHSGWRGTVQEIGPKAVRMMQNIYGSDPQEILACIGPSICGDCYEVGAEVADVFFEKFSQAEAERIVWGNANGRYQLDLWRANELLLEKAGILKEHMQVTGICTRCTPELLFSHRKMGNARGNLSAILCLKEA